MDTICDGIIAMAMCVTLCLSGCSDDSARSDSEQPDAQPVAGTTTPSELAKRTRDRLGDALTQDLDELLVSPDCSTALAAGWRRVLQTTTNPNVRSGGNARLEKIAVIRFLGLIEGRLRVSIPSRWERIVLMAGRQAPGLVSFDVRPTPPTAVESTEARSATTTLHRNNGQWVAQQDGKSWSIPAEDGLGPVDSAAIVIDGNMAYIALYSWPPFPYKIYALEGDRVLWSSRVFAAGDLMSYTGIGWHEVTLRVGSHGVTVFGVSGNVAYVEEFDKKTGDPTCRFSTLYLVAPCNGPRTVNGWE